MKGLPVEYELGLSTAEYAERRSKQLAERARLLMVHVACIAAGGEHVGYLNGVFYLGGGQDPLVLTTGHVLGWGGAVAYEAFFRDEDGSDHAAPLEMLKAGAVNHSIKAQPPAAHEYYPDLAVFRAVMQGGQAMPMLAPPMPPAVPWLGDKTFILAYTGADHNLNFTEGTVSSAGLDVYHTTAYADSGFSGAPVINTRGFLLGLVVRGIGTTIKQVAFIPSNVIQGFLLGPPLPLPGLPAL